MSDERPRSNRVLFVASAAMILAGVLATGQVIPCDALPVWILLAPLLACTVTVALVRQDDGRASRVVFALSPLLAFAASHGWLALNTLRFAPEVEAVSTAAWDAQAHEGNRTPAWLSKDEVAVYEWSPRRGGRLGLVQRGDVELVVEVAPRDGELAVVEVERVSYMSSGSSMVWPNR